MKPREVTYEVNYRGCHICTSHAGDQDGYPKFKKNGKTQRIHRYLWKLEYGEIDKGLILRHSCDDPRCINLKHLSLGTHKDNMNDMVIRGRNTKTAKLTKNDVLEIRKSDLTVKELSNKYKVAETTIRKLLNGESWSQL